jgi:ferredoxin--NADP+ reductase
MAEIKLPEVELNIYSPKSPVEVKVVENYVVTKESSPNFVRHITFDVSGTDLVDRVRVGQSVGILPPGTDSRGKAHKLRLYSISSPTSGEGGEKHLISTTVKRTIEEFEEKIYLGLQLFGRSETGRQCENDRPQRTPVSPSGKCP